MQRVSIIIPVLNEEQSIQQTLPSLQQYRQQGHEIIIVDGGSVDTTVAQAEHLCDKVIVSHPGRALQMNNGAKQAKRDVLLFLHADTLLPDNAVDLLLSNLESSGKVWGRFDVRLSSRHPLLYIVAWLMNLRSRLSGIATGDQAIFVRRQVFKTLEGFPEVALMEDIQLSNKLLSISRPVCLRQKVTTSSRRWEQNGIIRTILLMWYLRLAHYMGKSPKELARLYSK